MIIPPAPWTAPEPLVWHRRPTKGESLRFIWLWMHSNRYNTPYLPLKPNLQPPGYTDAYDAEQQKVSKSLCLRLSSPGSWKAESTQQISWLCSNLSSYILQNRNSMILRSQTVMMTLPCLAHIFHPTRTKPRPSQEGSVGPLAKLPTRKVATCQPSAVGSDHLELEIRRISSVNFNWFLTNYQVCSICLYILNHIWRKAHKK